ncbi:hypothetical protein [Isoptericola croceus]|uniref:hypothetical protein n=1 Tax=Isoptericola croceus TaxID=3031406 RepID=UPI0023F640E4|nr:hypothetical protein [Isoptericola croceus]
MTTTTKPAKPAKRGDLAIITFYATANSPARVELGVVASITRAGRIKAVRDVYGHRVVLDRLARRGKVVVVGADQIDVAAAMGAYSERNYPSDLDGYMVPPLADLDEARRLLHPHRTDAASTKASATTKGA